jgi:hypothetical protein
MPETEIRKRGGVVRWRTVKRNGHVYRIAVVRKRGKRGGHTLAKEVK